MKTLYLIGGTMGVGKTTTGHLLASKLKNSIYIEGDDGWKGIPFILNEENKRKVMKNIITMLNSALANDKYENVVFGWVMDQQTTINELVANLYKDHLTIIYISLLINKEELRRRIMNDNLNKERQKVVEDAIKRIDLYQDLNTIKIDVTNLSKDEVVNQILNIKKQHGIK